MGITIPIVCQFHIGATDLLGVPPSTSSDVARDEGWKMTSSKLFSQDGTPVAICPGCVRKARFYKSIKTSIRD